MNLYRHCVDFQQLGYNCLIPLTPSPNLHSPRWPSRSIPEAKRRGPATVGCFDDIAKQPCGKRRRREIPPGNPHRRHQQPQQDIGEHLRQHRDRQREVGRRVSQAVIRHHPPQANQFLCGQRLTEVEVDKGERDGWHNSFIFSPSPAFRRGSG